MRVKLSIGRFSAGNRHIYVRLRDIDAASLATRMQRTLTLRSPQAAAGGREGQSGGQHGPAGPRSALTALLNDHGSSSRYGRLDPSQGSQWSSLSLLQMLSLQDPGPCLALCMSWQSEACPLVGSRGWPATNCVN